MNTTSTPDALLAMILSLFLLGTISFVSGMIVLISRTLGRDIRQITSSTRKLAQKTLAHDLSGLVGNASALLTAANDMVRTSSGIGAFLLILGTTQMLAAIGLFIYFFGGTPAYDLINRYP